MYNISKINFKMPETDIQVLLPSQKNDYHTLNFKEILKNELRNPADTGNRYEDYADNNPEADPRTGMNAEDVRSKAADSDAENREMNNSVRNKNEKDANSEAVHGRENTGESENIIKKNMEIKETAGTRDDSRIGDKDSLVNGIDILLFILKGFQARGKTADDLRASLLELKDFLLGNKTAKNNEMFDVRQSLSRLESLFKKLNIEIGRNTGPAGGSLQFSEFKKGAMQLFEDLRRHVEKREPGRISMTAKEHLNETSRNAGNERPVATEPLRAVNEDRGQARNDDSSMNFQFFRRGANAAGRNPVSAELQKNTALNDRQFQNILDHARIAVSDNKNGSFSVRLYPESLGRVNVSLMLEDGVLAGRFLVESSEAKDAILANISTVRETLMESGISVGEFQVNVRDQKGASDMMQADLPVFGTVDNTVESDIYDRHSYYEHEGEIDVIV